MGSDLNSCAINVPELVDYLGQENNCFRAQNIIISGAIEQGIRGQGNFLLVAAEGNCGGILGNKWTGGIGDQGSRGR